MKLQGILPPITTPFHPDGELYQAKLRHNIECWNRTTLAGYVVTGSTGEAPMLSADEKQRLWEWTAEYAAPEKVLIAGTGVESVRDTVKLTNCAAAAGYKAALVRTPGYYRNLLNDPAAQMLYFRAVADQARIPVLIYNFPQGTGIDLPVAAIAELSGHPNITGIKESSGNLEKVAKLVREVEPGFQVLVGHAPTLWPSLMGGAVGAILAFANAAPYDCIALWEAFRAREYEAARDWQDRIADAAALVTSRYGVPGLKHAMELNGYYGGPPRLPLTPPSKAARREIEEAFRDLKG